MNIDTTIRELPQEILEQIFDRLPFRARLNAKLVGKRWFEILLAPKYRSREKFIVRGCYPPRIIDHVLSNLSDGRRLEHVEFHEVLLDVANFNCSFWKDHGPEIDELHFLNCFTIDSRTFQCMALYCVNLRSLYWRNSRTSLMIDPPPLICSYETLDDLINMNFSRVNLIIFQSETAPLNWLQKFRKVFPNADQKCLVYHPIHSQIGPVCIENECPPKFEELSFFR